MARAKREASEKPTVQQAPHEPWPTDAARVRPHRSLLIARYALLAGLAIFGAAVLRFYGFLADKPSQAVEMLVLPLLYLAFSLFCLNEYLVARPTDAWTAVKVMRRTFISLFVVIALTIGLRQLPVAWLVPKLPWMLGVLYAGLAGLLALGVWWWARVRFEYTSSELLWAEGFWAPTRWEWKAFTRQDRGGEGKAVVVWLYTQSDALPVPLAWPGADAMLRHVHAKNL